MNKLLFTSFFFISTIFTLSCNNEYLVKGNTCNFFDGSNVYLKSFAGGKWTTIDSCEILHGKFQMLGVAETASVTTLFIDNEAIIPIVLEEGCINIDIEARNVTLDGTTLNRQLSQFFRQKDYYEQLMLDLEREEASLILDGHTAQNANAAIQERMTKIDRELKTYIENFIKKHYNNVLGPCIFQLLCSSLPYPIMTEQINRIIEQAPENFLADSFVESFIVAARENSMLTE